MNLNLWKFFWFMMKTAISILRFSMHFLMNDVSLFLCFFTFLKQALIFLCLFGQWFLLAQKFFYWLFFSEAILSFNLLNPSLENCSTVSKSMRRKMTRDMKRYQSLMQLVFFNIIFCFWNRDSGTMKWRYNNDTNDLQESLDVHTNDW